MRRYQFETKTPLAPALLYRAITDINRWPEWNTSFKAAALHVPVFHGGRFSVTLRNGFKIPMLIETADPAERFVDVAILVFARLRTARSFTATDQGTVMSTVIEIWGPSAFLWDRILARDYAKRTEDVTERFLAFAGTLLI